MPVISVTGDQTADATGTLHDVIVTTFTVRRPDGTAAGPFSVSVPDDGNAVGATETYIEAKISEVNGIFGLNP